MDRHTDYPLGIIRTQPIGTVKLMRVQDPGEQPAEVFRSQKLHGLDGSGQPLCLARDFDNNPCGGGRSSSPPQPLGVTGRPTCTFCLKHA